MKLSIFFLPAVLLSVILLSLSCRKYAEAFSTENHASISDNSSMANAPDPDAGATLTEIPLSLTIVNPCCQEQVYFTGIIHRVENNQVIHMDSKDISGVGLTSGLKYTVQSTSVRNYQFDPNQNLATLNWSMRMVRDDGCGYNVKFVIHLTRNANGDIVANIHSGNFFCL